MTGRHCMSQGEKERQVGKSCGEDVKLCYIRAGRLCTVNVFRRGQKGRLSCRGARMRARRLARAGRRCILSGGRAVKAQIMSHRWTSKCIGQKCICLSADCRSSRRWRLLSGVVSFLEGARAILERSKPRKRLECNSQEFKWASLLASKESPRAAQERA